MNIAERVKNSVVFIRSIGTDWKYRIGTARALVSEYMIMCHCVIDMMWCIIFFIINNNNIMNNNRKEFIVVLCNNNNKSD